MDVNNNLTTDEMISKSLDEIEVMANEFADLSKAQNDENLAPSDVSEGAPEQSTGEGNEAPPEEDVDQNSTDVDEDVEGEEDTDEDEEVAKSLESNMRSNDNVAKALEVSEFLNELVKSISTVLGAHQQDLSKSMQASEHSNQLLAKSLLGITKAHQTIMKSQSELHKSMVEINKRLDTIEKQPMVRKSVSSNTQPIEKSFDASVGNKPQQAMQTLTKSQASIKLMQAYDSGNTEIMTDILALEGTGNFDALSPSAKTILGM